MERNNNQYDYYAKFANIMLKQSTDEELTASIEQSLGRETKEDNQGGTGTILQEMES